MRQVQLQTLFFGSSTRAGERLRDLFDHHFLERLIFPVFVGRSPTLYLLGRKGAEVLRQRRGDEIIWYPSSLHLTREKVEHTLAINDVYVAVTLACRELGYELAVWKTERELKADYDRVSITTSAKRRESVAVIPDSYFVVHEKRFHFFLELDRGKMRLSRFKDKVLAYEAYYKTGGYEKRYHTKGLRVLIVVSTEAKDGGERRMNELKKATEEATIARWFWFTTLRQLTPDSILTAPIWHQSHEKEPKILISLS